MGGAFVDRTVCVAPPTDAQLAEMARDPVTL